MVDHRIAFLVEYGRQMCLCHGHTHCHGGSGSQGARGGFNSHGVAVLRVSRGPGVQLPEVHQILLLQSVSEEMQQGIQHGRAMSCGQDETVPVDPVRMLRIMIHMMSPQFVCNGSCAQADAGMAGICLLNLIHSKDPDGIYAFCVDRIHQKYLL